MSVIGIVDNLEMMTDTTGGYPPLDGLVVLDLSRVLAGPYAAMLLGDLGARVIKVERPEAGDDTRHWGPPFIETDGEPESTYFLSTNRNKESIALDFKSEGDREVLEGLIRRSDVLIENFRVGVMDRLGLDQESLEELNPRLITLSITGFGTGGPESGRVGYDQILQGEGGFMSFTGPDPSRPTKAGVPIADILAGMFGVQGVLAALVERERSGRGQIVRTSLLAGQIAIHAFQGTRWLIAGEVPEPAGNHHPTVAPYGAFEARDGMLNIAVGNDTIWGRFAPLVGLGPEDERFATNERRVLAGDELRRLVGEALAGRDVEEWLRLFDEHGVPAGEIKSLDRVYSSEQVISQGLICKVEHTKLGEIRLPGSPIQFGRSTSRRHTAPPLLDEHGEEIRQWAKTSEPTEATSDHRAGG